MFPNSGTDSQPVDKSTHSNTAKIFADLKKMMDVYAYIYDPAKVANAQNYSAVFRVPLSGRSRQTLKTFP